MSCVIRVIGRADGEPSSYDGRYLLSEDVDANGGRGFLATVVEPVEAKQFKNVGDALMYWNRQSKRVPLRDDGKPNRPLTAFSVEIVQDGREPSRSETRRRNIQAADE